MKRALSLVLVSIGIFFCGFGPVFGQPTDSLADRLQTITDQALQKTLANSVSIGLIQTDQEFDAALSEALARKIRGNPEVYNGNNNQPSDLSPYKKALSDQIAKLAEPIAKLDRDALKKVPMNNSRAGNLFGTLQEKVPASYEATYNLTTKFNPKVGTYDSPALDKDIDAYLHSISGDPVIKYALDSTQTTIGDLKRNWFGTGAGFEHVIAGEYKGGEVSGYHWWYKFYCDEKAGRAKYLKTLDGFNNPRVFTGQFSWDPDGSGPISTAMKKKGGFSIGNSPMALLAIGHIAMESARKLGSIPGAMTFRAGINGEVMNWQVYTMGGSLRSLFPMISKGGNDVSIQKYYESEEDALKAFSAEGSKTIH